MNKNCKRAINTEARLFKVYLKHKTNANFERYKKTKKSVLELYVVPKGGSKGNWLMTVGDKRNLSNYVRSRSIHRETIGPLVHDDIQICEALNIFLTVYFPTSSILHNIFHCPNDSN